VVVSLFVTGVLAYALAFIGARRDISIRHELSKSTVVWLFTYCCVFTAAPLTYPTGCGRRFTGRWKFLVRGRAAPNVTAPNVGTRA
jgi:hypothetical protein